MGGASGRQYVIEEQLKPADASDIADGDWETAKKEVARLRDLINKVDCELLDEIEEIEEKKVDQQTTKRALSHKSQEIESDIGVMDSVMVDENDDDAIIAPPLSAIISRQESTDLTKMQSLLGDIKTKVFETTKNLQAAFARFDSDFSGYISRDEFREAMAEYGMPMTEEEFELVNKTYPHKESAGEVDKGIGYLEFVSMLTGKLTFVPGAGEEDCGDELFRVVMQDGIDKMPPLPENADTVGQVKSEATMLWGNYEEAKEKRTREIELQKVFNRRVFDSFYNMKEAFDNADKDKSGYIEREELVDVLQSTMGIEASQHEVELLIKEFDANNDGKLAYNEFVKCLQYS